MYNKENNAETTAKRPYLPKAEYLKAKKAEKKDFIESHYESHQVNLVYLLKNNSEIRRFTSLNILSVLEKEGVVNKDCKSKLVKFGWDKFSVIIDGLGKDYRYTETFFIQCLINSFALFADSATKTIKEFMDKEDVELPEETKK